MKQHFGTFKKGVDRSNPKQVKWERATMSKKFIGFLATQICVSFPPYSFIVLSPHCKDKYARHDASIDFSIVRSTLMSPAEHIIEYSEVATDDDLPPMRRVLLRNHRISRPVSIGGRTVECNLCFVLGLDEHCIVTYYWNAVTDHHATLDRSKYCKEKKTH